MNHFKSIWFHRYVIVVPLLVVLGACAPVLTNNTATVPAPELSATLEMPANLPDGNRVMIQFTLTNNSHADLYVLKWYTPLEGIGGEIFRVKRDGQAIPYTGILAMRGDPTPEAYQLLGAAQSVSTEVDLSTSFDFSQPGEYTIQFLSPRISHVARSEAEMARTVDDLGPVEMPANPVTVEIGGSPAEEAPSTINVAGQPLPHSPKGYELYSWYEADEGNWTYTLVTGTNRLKTLEEVRTRTNVVRPDGWARITAEGEGPLKAELRRLPEGEQITWIGPKWLKQASADAALVGAIGLPDRATIAELEGFCRELGVNLQATPAQGASSTPAPAPEVIVFPGATGQDTEAPQLALREWPVVAAEIDGPGHLEYDDRLGDEILDRIKALRDQSAERSLALTNEALAPFGYRLDSRFDADWNRAFYDLYREGEAEPLLPGLSPLCEVPLNASVKASGTDFALVVENAPNTSPLYLLVNSDEVQKWDSGESWARPGYVGDDLARVTRTGDVSFTYQVELGTRSVYTGTAALYGAYMPLRSFTAWDDHWVLEVDDHLIMDGQDIGQALGYDAAFGFARIGGQSFYFLEQNGLVGISYGDQVMPNLYDRVFHNACCEAVIHNPEAGPEAIWFHASRDGTWYWVEAGTLVSSQTDELTDDEQALQSLVDFFEHLSAGRYEEAGHLYGGSYEVLSEYNPTLDPHDHAAMWQAACTSNGFQCLRVRSARLQEDGSAKAEYRFLVEFFTPDDQLFVRGPCCGASETEMPPESEFLFAVVRTEDGAYRVQDLPVYIP
jgi:hypothetical protein